MVKKESVRNAGKSTGLLPAVMPAPQQYAWSSGAEEWLDMSTLKYFIVPPAFKKVMPGVEMVNEKLVSMGLDPLQVSHLPQKKSIHLSIEPDSEMAEKFPGFWVPKAEGYRLLVDKEDIFILGCDLSGLFYGLMTLLQLIIHGRAARVIIKDWPDIKMRAVECSLPPEVLPGMVSGDPPFDTIYSAIPVFARMKLNMLVHLFVMWYPDFVMNYGTLSLKPGDNHYDDYFGVASEYLQEIFKFARKYFMEPVPMCGGFSHINGLLGLNPNIIEGDSCEMDFRVADGEVQSRLNIPSPLKIKNGDFQIYEAASNVAKGWNQDKPGVTSFIIPASGIPGEVCLKLVASGGKPVTVWQDVTCESLKSYTLKFRVKTAGIAGGFARVAVCAVNPDSSTGIALKQWQQSENISNWTYQEIELDTRLNTKLRICLCLESAKGEVMYDNITGDGVEGVNDLDNIIITPSAPLTIFYKGRKLTEGTHYRLDNSLLSYPYKIGNRLHIYILNNSVPDGESVKISYTKAEIRADDYSMTACPSEPIYRCMMETMLVNVVHILKPNYVHIGHDEVSKLNCDKRCTDRHVTDEDLFADEVSFWRNTISNLNPNIKVMMWGDEMSPYHDPTQQYYPDVDLTHIFPHIPADMIISIWWYADPVSGMHDTVKFYLEKGFRITGSPSYIPDISYEWAQCLYQNSSTNPMLILGGIYTSWPLPGINEWEGLTTFAEYFWTATKPPYPGKKG